MPSVLNVDTLTDAAGTGPVALTKQEAIKHYVYLNGEGTISTVGSLNNSSITDNGTGDYSATRTNSFSAVDYFSVGLAGQDAGNGRMITMHEGTLSVSANRFKNVSDNGSFYDDAVINYGAFGDLA